MTVVLKLEAEISASKRIEFSQSFMSFINELPSCPGFISFKEQPGTHFAIDLLWSNSTFLQEFQNRDMYRVFMGAIITLSSSYKSQILESNIH